MKAHPIKSALINASESLASQPVAAYTPGPWIVAPNSTNILAGNPDDPTVVADAQPADIMIVEDPDEIEANARLIAACPDLLGVCERLASWESNPEGLSLTVVSELIRQARAALARAKGAT